MNSSQLLTKDLMTDDNGLQLLECSSASSISDRNDFEEVSVGLNSTVIQSVVEDYYDEERDANTGTNEEEQPTQAQLQILTYSPLQEQLDEMIRVVDKQYEDETNVVIEDYNEHYLQVDGSAKSSKFRTVYLVTCSILWTEPSYKCNAA